MATPRPKLCPECGQPIKYTQEEIKSLLHLRTSELVSLVLTHTPKQIRNNKRIKELVAEIKELRKSYGRIHKTNT